MKHPVYIKFKILSLLFCLSLFLCGYYLPGREVVLDTEKPENRVYRYITADTLLEKIRSTSVYDPYQKKDFAVLGRVGMITDYWFVLQPLKGTGNPSVTCRFDDYDKAAVLSSLKTGDQVRAFGRLNIDLLTGVVEMAAEQVKPDSLGSDSPEIYGLLSGKTMNKSSSPVRSLHDGRIRFTIPVELQDVEHDILAEGLGNMEGYQYTLNYLTGPENKEPESFFIGYFDKKEHLKNIGDKTETEAIEKAIIASILKIKTEDVGRLFKSDSAPFFGKSRYLYYQDAWQDSFGGAYHLEFAFEEPDPDSILVYLYVYRKPVHLEEIMLIMQLLE
ncbi:MAG: hypothetical protein K6G83_00225 [Lachnospiraceae bacterium]|nr:hypothetical protein [Lachnospiraceae bacterium]